MRLLHRSVWRVLVVFTALLVVSIGRVPVARAQGTEPDVVRGRVVTPDSQPVANAIVKLTGTVSQSTRQVRSDTRGNFSLLMPSGEGDYLLEVTAVGYLPVQMRLRREGDVEVLRANVVMRKAPQNIDAARIVEARRPPREITSVDVSGGDKFLGGTPLPADVQGDLLQMAATIPGIALVLNPDGSIAGVSALGLTPAQNSTRLNGLPINNTSMPRDATSRTSVATTSYDPARGGFSGAQISVASIGGGELSTFSRHMMRLTFDDPSLQATDPAVRSLRPEYRSIIGSGRIGGPIIRDTLGYSISWQGSRRTSPLNSLFDADADGLARLGVASDSVARLATMLTSLGIPVRALGGGDRRTDAASVMAQLDYSRSAGAQFSTTLNASLNDNANSGVSSRSVPAFGGKQSSWNLTLQERASTYVGSTFLNDLAVGLDMQDANSVPYLRLPQGSVLVSSAADGGASPTTVSFGSGAGLRSQSNSGSVSMLDQVSWFLGDNRHRVKTTIEASYGWNSAVQHANADGSFSYLSLADLQAGKASVFSRRLNTPSIAARAVSGGVSLGDTFRRTNRMQIQFGVRADAALFPTKPAYNARLDDQLGVRTDHAPNDWGVSPRFGFSWTLGSPPPAIAGIVFGPAAGRYTVRGGFGRFWGMPTPVANTMMSAIDQTGLPSGAQQITCIGAEVPSFNWSDALANPGTIPQACAGGAGATSFAIVQPRVQAFEPGFRAPSSWRGNLEFTGYVTNRLRGGVNIQYSENTHLSASVDRNFSGTRRFALAAEGGRPVFVNPAGIVGGTGQASLADSRVTTEFAQVMANRGDGHSRSVQLTLTATPQFAPICISRCINLNFSYTTIAVRDAVRGFGGNTDGDPRTFGWARSSGNVRHQLQTTTFFGWQQYVQMSLTGTFRSGVPFTPIVAGDVNGDGSSGNDRAFVFAPGATTDATVSGAMQSLLTNGSSAAKRCLRANIGRVAERNSCEGPWTATMNASINLSPGAFGLPARLMIGLNFVNPLTGLDALVNGTGNLKGWGQSPAPDPVLLYVRGFDPVTNGFRYEVNQRFGETRANRSIPTAPFQAQLDVRWAFGTSIDEQSWQNQIRRITRPGAPPLTTASAKQALAGPRAGTFAQVLQMKDSLKLTPGQLSELNAMQAKYAAQVDTAYTPAATRIAARNGDPMDPESWRLMDEASRKSAYALLDAAEQLIAMLTPEQRKRGSSIFIINPDWLRISRESMNRRVASFLF